MKKIFVLTGEPSGDKLASKVISDLKKINPNLDYLSVGGENIKSLGIKSIYDLKEITYLGFTNVILNLFKINKKINQTVKAIIDYNPDILLVGADWKHGEVVGREYAKKVSFFERFGGYSSTEVIRKCKDA